MPRRTARGAPIVIALVVVACPQAAASPQFTQTASVKLTDVRAGHATGLGVRIAAADPGAASGRPAATEVISIELAAGATANTMAATRCTLPREQIATGACPVASRVGNGSATFQGGLGAGDAFDVQVFNRPGGIALRLMPKTDSSLEPRVLLGSLSARGVLTLSVPQSGTFASFESSLVFLAFNIERRTTGKGRKELALLRSPRTCTRRGFVSRAVFTYTDATSATRTTRQRCSQGRS